MAWTEKKKRRDGGVSARVVWRLGGTREGFVRPRGEADPLKVLSATRVRGALIFTKPVTSVNEPDLNDWLIDWDRSLKTNANYHGLIHGGLRLRREARLPRRQPGHRHGAQAITGQAIAT